MIHNDSAVCLGEPINPDAIMFAGGMAEVVIKSNICSIRTPHVCEIE